MTQKAIIIDTSGFGVNWAGFQCGDTVYAKRTKDSVDPANGGLWKVSSDGVNWSGSIFGKRLKFIESEKLTVLDLEVGEEYRIHPDLVQEHGYYPGVYTKHDGFSTREGKVSAMFIVNWKGHEKLEVVRVVKEKTPEVGEQTPKVLPASSVPPVTVKRKVLTIANIGVGQTFIVHGKPEEVYVKISNSHVFNHKLLQMHATDAQRFQSHLNLVVVELVVYNGK